jgi:alkylhydroperoxidase/carboxymuconolactone decarboxylase family protein YurZ
MSEKTLPKPPKAYKDFVGRYPKLGDAWDLINEAGEAGPLDPKTARLVKFAIAIGAMREGAIRSGVRKARAMGISEDELRQVVSLAPSLLGMPATVAVDSWVSTALEKKD